MPPLVPALVDTVGIPGDWLYTEQPHYGSRKTVTLLGGDGADLDLKSGQVLGRLRGAITDAPFAGNTGGSGVIGTVVGGAGVKEGVYKAICIEPGTGAAKFNVYDPEGIVIGVATEGAEFVGGGLTFTISDATDFVVGDGFNITVAVGTTYAPYNEDGDDGSEIPVGILLFDTYVYDAVNKDAVMLDRDAQVRQGGLVWTATADAGEILAGEAALEKLGIRMRTGDV